LLKAAQGCRWVATDVATREPVWERVSGTRSELHLERFLQIAFYSRTRSAAVLDLRWRRHKTPGFIDFADVTLHGEGPQAQAQASRKRQPLCRIHDKLLPLLQKWRDKDLEAAVARVVHFTGAEVKRVSKGFRLAAVWACLDRREIDGNLRVNDLTVALAEEESDEAIELDEGYVEDKEADSQDELGWPSPIFSATQGPLSCCAPVCRRSR
jgi:hypothetical protein